MVRSNGEETRIERVSVAVSPKVLAACSVNVKEPGREGVPVMLIAAVASGFVTRAKPSGKVPVITVQRNPESEPRPMALMVVEYGTFVEALGGVTALIASGADTFNS